MIDCFITDAEEAQAFALHPLDAESFKRALGRQSEELRAWIKKTGFTISEGQFLFLPPGDAGETVWGAVKEQEEFTSWAALAERLPPAIYRLPDEKISEAALFGWAMGCYSFEDCRGREAQESRGKKYLLLPEKKKFQAILDMVEAIGWGRDLVNRPANSLTPSALVREAVAMAEEYNASCEVIEGDALKARGYPLVFEVGKAASDPPQLVDIRWGEEKHPLVALVGKGVCFDTGGLDLKPSRAMALMKKDMGGAAHIMVLAKLVMQAGLPVRLRVLLPVVENSVGGNAMRPGDVYQSGKGLTVEIGNTDAEGRLILADALFAASSESPALMIDVATLTGAARVALGPELPNMFSNDDALAERLVALSMELDDPLWRMPLWPEYRPLLKGDVADLTNAPAFAYAGAITAALFLEEFIGKVKSWIHLDVMAFNIRKKPGRPKGGEIQAMRAVFSLLQEKFPEPS